MTPIKAGSKFRPLINILKLKPTSSSSSCDFQQVFSEHTLCRCFSLWRIHRTEYVSLFPKTTTVATPSFVAAPAQQRRLASAVVKREQFIPLTCQSLIRFLIEEKNFLTEEERALFPNFANGLHTALSTRYLGVLEELKLLFDPSNPDKETLKSKELTGREILDNELSLLQLLEDVVTKANFQEIPQPEVQKILGDNERHRRIQVKVDQNRYGVLRLWGLGHEVPQLQVSPPVSLWNKLLRRSPRSQLESYKRVLVAVRLKNDLKLTLKVFKEVPAADLENLLPDGSIHMRPADKGVLVASAAVAGLGVVAKVAGDLVNMANADLALAVTLLSAAVGVRTWYRFAERRDSYLTDVSRTLYWKNISSNRGLLKQLVSRAKDESLKEALLVYAFLLNSQPHDLRRKIKSFFITLPEGGLTAEDLESQIEKWVQKRTGAAVKFDSSQGVKFLKHLNILSDRAGQYHVLQLDEASGLVPAPVNSPHATEADIPEGYDRNQYLETVEEYKSEETKYRRYGWF